MTERFEGVIAPVLTPFNDDSSVSEDLYLDHCGRVLAAGAHYLSPFGTTGEAASVSMAERMDALEIIVASGAAKPEQLMPGTGLCSLPETLELTRHAVELGCAAVMTLPPFFYMAADDEGLFRFFRELIEGIASNRLKICLYNIPQNAGIGFSPELSARLTKAFPDTVTAYKDSCGKWEHTQAVLDAAPGISVFPGSEAFLVQGMAAGGAGCISATCNTNADKVRAVYEAARAGDNAAVEKLEPAMQAYRQAMQAAGLIPAQKSMIAYATGEKRWLNLRAPHLNADAELGERLAGTLPFEYGAV